MCRLCQAVPQMGFEELIQQDIVRLELTKQKEPSNKACFSNLPDWQSLKFSSALFEPLMPYSSPQNYYQPIFIDGQKTRNDWASGWVRSISFLPDSLLLYTKTTQREPFKNDEWFLFFLLLKIPYSSLQITHEPPRFILRADDLELPGTNLLTGQPATHKFSFTFSHVATDKNAVRSSSVANSALVRETIQRRPSPATTMPKSEFEKFTVTTYYFTPHPLIMRQSKELGFDQRFNLQLEVPKFLDEHFRNLKS